MANNYINPLNTKLDANQVLIRSYDEVENALRVNAKVTATVGSVDVIIDAASGDNIAISDGVDTLAINNDGSINVIVQDITLSKDNDSIEVFQANHDNLNVNANIQVNNTDVSNANPVPISDAGSSITVDAIDLDIRNLSSAMDSITVIQGTSPFVTSTTNGALETTQQLVLTQAQNANTSLDNIEADVDATRIALQSIDSDIDVVLSTRASEATQVLNNTQLQNINAELDTQTISLNAIELDVDAIRVSTQSIDSDIDVPLSSRASEATQVSNNTQLVAINSSLDAIEIDTDAIRIAVQSIDLDIDTNLASRASEFTQVANNTELGFINTELDAQTILATNTNTKLDTLIAKDFSTAANQVTAQATLTAINNKFNSLGQKTSAASAPVVLSSDQSSIPVTQGTTPWVVSGNSAVGAVPANNPVSVSGADAGGLKRHIRTDALGRVEINTIQSIPQLPTTLSNGNLRVESQLPNNYSRGIFGSARVVTTQNVFETLFSFDKQPNVWDEVIASLATSVFNPLTNSIDMTTNTTVGSSVIRQTFRRVRYNPSRTVQLISSGMWGAGKVNVRKRIGQFDLEDGVFFEQDSLINYVVRRTSTSGTPVDTRTPQSAWNIDKFDGTGASGITIDFSKHQAFFVQYAFQGFADITYGFYLNGQIMFCHKEQTANILANPFMRTGHLPLRVEITNTGGTASSTTFSYNSFSVKNEGEDSETEGQVRSYSLAPLKSVGTAITPVLSIRLGPGFQKGIVDILSTTIFVNTVDEVIWSMYLSPVLAGATFAITQGYTQIDTSALSMTGGTELISGILSQTNSSTISSQDLLKLVNSLIGSSILGTSQIITIAARSRLGSADVLSAIVWREYP